MTLADMDAVLLHPGYSYAEIGIRRPSPTARPVPVRGGLTRGRQSRALRDVERDLAMCRAAIWVMPPLRVVERVA